MTKEEIYEVLGIADANEDTKQSILQNITATVELRFAGIVDDLMSDEQVDDLEKATADSNDPEVVASWLKDNVPEAAQLYEAILGDHIEEIKEQRS